MPPAEKEKVYFQDSGPPPYLFNPNHNDSVSIAATNYHSGDLRGIPSLLETRSVSVVCSPRMADPQVDPSNAPNDSQSGPPEFNFDNYSTIINHSHFIYTHPFNSDRPPTMSDFRLSLWQGQLTTMDGANRQKELQRLTLERRIRDDNELYAGLRAFKGRQRGWNGEHESIRQKTLSEYREQQERPFWDAHEKDKAVKRGKDPTTPRKQCPEPGYSGMSSDQVIFAKAKHVEEGYSELYAKGMQATQDYDDYIEIFAEENYRKMMNRHWDLDQIKRDALEEQKTRFKMNSSKQAKDLVSKNLKRKDGDQG
jgi:hypothetical protein